MRKNIFKKVALGLGVALLLIQLVPGDKNEGTVNGPDHIAAVVDVPQEVEQVLSSSCYDCHSNRTAYPWYSKIQPLRMWLDHHVEEGKHELNFSEFATYKLKRQLHKLDEVVETIDEKEMPLESYTLIHKNAVLSEDQKRIVILWARQSKLELDTTQ